MNLEFHEVFKRKRFRKVVVKFTFGEYPNYWIFCNSTDFLRNVSSMRRHILLLQKSYNETSVKEINIIISGTEKEYTFFTRKALTLEEIDESFGVWVKKIE